MKFTREIVLDFINKALNDLYNKDAFLLQKNLNITERSITHKLGMYIQFQLSEEIDVDCEYNRMGRPIDGEIMYTDGDYFAKTICLAEGYVPDDDDKGSRVFPDIIIHKRGTSVNYVVIEIKIAWKNSKKSRDILKLSAYKTDLKYQHALYVELNEERENVIIEEI